jgi:hypothetical protein
MLLSDPQPIVMCDFDNRTARWGLDVPATLLARADEVMNAEYPLLGVKRTWRLRREMSACDPERTISRNKEKL